MTAEGGATTGSGQVGNGIVLDGTNDQLEAIGYKGVTGGSARSLETWIKMSGTNQAFMSWGQMLSTKNGPGEIESGRQRVEMNNGGRESNVAINNNTWRHVAAVFPENATNLDSIGFMWMESKLVMLLLLQLCLRLVTISMFV